jgi:hypothetical protein
VRKLALAALFAVGFICAGGLSAGVIASTVATGTTDTVTSTIPTTTVPTTTAPKPPRPQPAIVAPGVRVGGVRVGGLTATQARGRVSAAFARPLLLRVGPATLRARPAKLGARAYVKTAVARALTARPRSRLPLAVTIDGSALRRYTSGLERRYDRRAVDATLSLRDLRPWITPDRPGRVVGTASALPRIVRALHTGSRLPIRVPVRTLPARVTSTSFGPIIVIRRGSNRLYLYDGMRLWRVFGVATGQAAYPTPLGTFSIAVMWRNPWWYPPNSAWAKGASPIPPGPGNPLGTRWMGLTAPGVGIHGTPDPASIGYSASHGCIRMRIPEAEWLFNHVYVGTTVFIVAA